MSREQKLSLTARRRVASRGGARIASREICKVYPFASFIAGDTLEVDVEGVVPLSFAERPLGLQMPFFCQNSATAATFCVL